MHGARAKYRRAIAVALVGGCVVYAGMAYLVAGRSHPDPYLFLNGNRPIISGVNAMRYTEEYRIYSWDQGYKGVVASADKELASMGFQRDKAKDPSYTHAAWSRLDGTSVYMDPGVSHTRKQALGNEGRVPGGVTVIVGNNIPDDWMAHVRLVLEPSDW